MRLNRRDLLSLLGLGALATAFLWPVVGGGRCLAGGDLLNSYLPYRHVVNEAIRAGEWPWWNPWTFCGQPILANLNAALFYPPNLLSVVVPLAQWFGWTVWLHVLWGLAGAYLFQRRAGVGALAAMLGAAVFWGSGFFIFNLWSGIVLFHQAGAWWPWAMLGVLAWMQSGRPAWIALASVSLAFTFLAGAPQVTFYAAGTAGLFGLTLLFGRPAWRQRLLGLAGVFVLAALLVQIQFGPAREFGAMSQRATYPSQAAWALQTGDSLSPRSLVLALAPTLCGDPTDAALYWGTLQGFHEVVPAVMTPALLLVVAGLIAWLVGASAPRGTRLEAHSPRWIVFHLIVGSLALFAAFGRHSPLFALLWRFVPGFQEFRVPARLSLISLWCLACLSASLFDRLLVLFASPEVDAARTRRVIAVSGCVISGLGILALIVFTTVDMRALLMRFGAPPGVESQLAAGVTAKRFLFTHLEQHPELLTMARTALITWALAVLLTGLSLALWATWPRLGFLALGLLLAALFQTLPPRKCLASEPGATFYDRFYPRSEVVDVIRRSLRDGRMLCLDSVFRYERDQENPELYPNRPLVNDLPDARGYDPIIPAAYTRWTNYLNGDPQLSPETPAYGILNIYRIGRLSLLRPLDVTVVAASEPLDDPNLEPLWDDGHGLRLYRVIEPGGSAQWRPAGVPATPDPHVNLFFVSGGRPDIFDPARQVLIAGEVPRDLISPEVSSEATVSLVERGFDHVVFDVEATGPGYLITDTPCHPGWHARVDGEAATVFQGDTLWTTVLVQGGRHRVELRFLPASLVRGALFSLAGLVLVLGLCFVKTETVPQRSCGTMTKPSETR